ILRGTAFLAVAGGVPGGVPPAGVVGAGQEEHDAPIAVRLLQRVDQEAHLGQPLLREHRFVLILLRHRRRDLRGGGAGRRGAAGRCGRSSSPARLAAPAGATVAAEPATEEAAPVGAVVAVAGALFAGRPVRSTAARAAAVCCGAAALATCPGPAVAPAGP